MIAHGCTIVQHSRYAEIAGVPVAAARPRRLRGHPLLSRLPPATAHRRRPNHSTHRRGLLRAADLRRGLEAAGDLRLVRGVGRLHGACSSALTIGRDC